MPQEEARSKPFGRRETVAKTSQQVELNSQEITRLHKKVLMNPDGYKLLQHWVNQTINKPVEENPKPVTQDQAFAYWIYRRFREGQNDIIYQILKEVEKDVPEPMVDTENPDGPGDGRG